MNNTLYTYMPVYYYYPVQQYTPYMMCPQQIVLQNTVQPTQQLNNATNATEIQTFVNKQSLEDTKSPEIKEDCHTDSDGSQDEYISDDENYEIKDTNDRQEKNYAVNQLKCSTNIQKNYAKAVIMYAKQQSAQIAKEVGDKKAVSFQGLLKRIKNKVKNIAHITKFTKDSDFIRLFRILAHKFIQTDSVCYIYNSKIQQKTSHLKGKSIIKKTLYKI